MDCKGKFIVFEGMDASGKTTQIKLLYKELLKRNLNPLLTREPGGTSISEEIRELILSPSNIKMHRTTEALLYAASRAQHVHQVIIPALKEGRIILCDRFVLSSLVYQGYGRELGVDAVQSVNNMALDGLKPDITFVLMLDTKEAERRVSQRSVLDRIELERLEFHERVNNGFAELVKKDNTLTPIDASKTIDEIHDIINQFVYRMIYTDEEIEQIMNPKIDSDISCDSSQNSYFKQKLYLGN